MCYNCVTFIIYYFYYFRIACNCLSGPHLNLLNEDFIILVTLSFQHAWYYTVNWLGIGVIQYYSCIHCIVLSATNTYPVELWPVWTESTYPDLRWRLCSVHYYLWGSCSGHYVFDAARDVHCNIIMLLLYYLFTLVVKNIHSNWHAKHKMTTFYK